VADENTILGKTQAFNCSLEFLKTYYKQEQTQELRIVLSGMLMGPSGKPEDANTMYTWVESLAKLRSVSVEAYHDENEKQFPEASAKEWFETTKGYIGYFNNTWKSEQFNKIISDLDSVDFSNVDQLSKDPVWTNWLQHCG